MMLPNAGQRCISSRLTATPMIGVSIDQWYFVMMLELYVMRDSYGDYAIRDTFGHVYGTMTVSSEAHQKKLADLFETVDMAFSAGFKDARAQRPMRRFDLVKRSGALVIVDDEQHVYGSVDAGILNRLSGRKLMETVAATYRRGRFIFENRQTFAARRAEISDAA